MAASKEERDTLLGQKLGRAIAGTAPESQCPDKESIAALVDRTVTDSERDRLMKHIAACPDCLQLYTLTAELIQPVEQADNRSWVVMVGSIAAVLVAVFGFLLANRPVEQQIAHHAPPPSETSGSMTAVQRPSAELAQAVSSKTKQEQAAEEALKSVVMAMAGTLPKNVSLTPVAIDTTLGFATQPDLHRDHLSLGRNLFLLEICLARNDRGATINTLKEISRMAERLNLPVTTQRELKQLSEGVFRKKSLEWARSEATSFVSSALDAEGKYYLALGGWVQGSIMAAEAEQKEYFSSNYFRRTAAYLGTARFPADLSSLVQELSGLGQQAALGEKEYRRIELVGKLLAGD